MPLSLKDKMEQFNDMDFFNTEASAKQLAHTGSAKNLHQNIEENQGQHSHRIYSTFSDTVPGLKNIASSPNFFSQENDAKNFFEEEQNTKKKTTKKVTTRTTSDGRAQTQEKIEETVTEEIVTVIKRPIAQSNKVANGSPRPSEKQESATRSTQESLFPSIIKEASPGQQANLDKFESIPTQILDNSLSSTQSKQKLKRIKEEDEEE